MKCPDCKTKLERERNGDWRCQSCNAVGVTVRGKPGVLERHVTFSGRFKGYRLNPDHPGASLLTRIRP